MPLLQTSGNVTADGYGGGVAAVPNYIEDVFSTYLYTGTATSTPATQTITNGIDLSTKGGMVWVKGRVNSPDGTQNHWLADTVRGASNLLSSNNTFGNLNQSPYGISAFSTTGFSVSDVRSGGTNYEVNVSPATYTSWTFRKQPKFFDIVTYTGNSATNRAISHSLGSTPGCIIFKCTSSAGNWKVYHNTQSYMADLDSTAAFNQSFSSVGFVSTNSTTFTVTGASDINTNGQTYVAYIFANNAGGFGLTGTDNVISCGSFTTSSGVATVNLGYEPQYVLYRLSSTTDDWWISDNMRGMSMTQNNVLFADLSDAESSQYPYGVTPTSTGFTYNIGSGTYTGIYIAIRRGPMKVPTSGTSVFGLNARTGTGANATVTGSAGVSDAVIVKNRGSAVADLFSSRLTGTGYLVTSSTAAEVAAGTTILQASPWDVMDGVKVGTTSTITNASSNTFVNYLFKRAPSFFDEVCYTDNGTGSLVVNHNLQAVPELAILKKRNGVNNWDVSYTNTLQLNLDVNSAASGGALFPTLTSTTFTAPGYPAGSQIVVYLFATCAGVSKVGSYTGNGTTQTIDCGFTGGARFVLIKRTDSTGDWYVYDTARGMTVLIDPYLLLNSTAAESATLGSVTTVSTGFAVNASILAAINTNAASYIFLAIA